MIRFGAVAILGLASASIGASLAQERPSAEVVTEIARTTKTATGQPIALPQGPLQVVATLYALGARRKTAGAQASVSALCLYS